MNFIVIKTSYPEESTELLIPKPPYIVWDIQDPPWHYIIDGFSGKVLHNMSMIVPFLPIP